MPHKSGDMVLLLRRRADPKARQDRRTRCGVRHDLREQFGPSHAAAAHRFLQRVSERRVWFGTPKKIGDLTERAKRILARSEPSRYRGGPRGRHHSCGLFRSCDGSFLGTICGRCRKEFGDIFYLFQQTADVARCRRIRACVPIEYLTEGLPCIGCFSRLAAEGRENVAARLARLAFDDLERQHAGGQPLLTHGSVSDPSNITGLRILPQFERRAVTTLEQAYAAERLDERARTAHPVEPGDTCQPTREPVLVWLREKLVPKAISEPRKQPASRG